MNRLIVYFLILATLTTCNNISENKKEQTVVKADTATNNITQKQDTANNPTLAETNQNPDSSLIGEFKKYKTYTLADTIKVDLNSDKVSEISYFTNNDTKKGIIIIDGQTKKQIIVGLDKSFGDMGSDFSWVDFWGITNDSDTYEVIIKDSEVAGTRKVRLENASLFVRKTEVGGGLITFKKGKYIWIHQSD